MHIGQTEDGEIRPLAAGDRPDWERLYRGYAEFYRVETNTGKLDTLFGWLMDAGHPCTGLVAVARDGAIVGLAHYRAMPSPLRGQDVGFLDDLFVDPARRGDGAGEALLRHLDEIAASHGWGVCAGSRATTIIGRAVFTTGCRRIRLITYEMTAASTGR